MACFAQTPIQEKRRQNTGIIFLLARHSADLSAVLSRAREAGVERLMVTGGSLEESRAALQLAREHPDQVSQELEQKQEPGAGAGAGGHG